MTSKGASAVLGPAVTVNPGASMTTFTVLPLPPHTAGPTCWPPREQHLLPLMTPSFPAGQPVVLPAFPGIPLVAGDAGHGPTRIGAGNIITQVRSEMGRAGPPQTQTLVLTQAPLNWNSPGALSGGAACPAPQFLATSVVPNVILAPAVGGTQTVQGGWPPGLPPQAQPQAAQVVPIFPPVNAGPWPNGASRQGGLATSPCIPSLVDSGNSTSVYENFRRWQRFKPLARRQLPQSPDAEALSCFLIPVIRTLSRRNPTMTLEDGLKWAMREWQHTSNFDRMIFYEMAHKFMEFEEEEMETQKLQWMQGAQGLPFQGPPRPDPPEPLAPVVDLQPEHIPRKDRPREQPAFLQPQNPQLPQETKVPEEIPPEAVREYMDIMDDLEGLARSATGEAGGEWEEDRKDIQQEDNETYPDPGLQSYIDELCSQEDFVTKVGAVIHLKFLEYLLSPEQELNPLDLAEELDKEEALTLDQLGEKQFQNLKKETVQAPPNHGAPQLDSSHSEYEASEDTSRCGHGLFKDSKSHCPAEAHLSGPKASDVFSECHESPPLQAQWCPSPPEGHRHISSGLGPRDASVARETSPVKETQRPGDWSGEDEEVLPSLSFLLGSQNSLFPWQLPQSPVPDSGLVLPEGPGDQGAPQTLYYQGIGFSQVDPSAVKSRKRALDGDPGPAEKSLQPDGDLGVPGRPALALEPVHSSQFCNINCDPFVTGKRRKRH